MDASHATSSVEKSYSRYSTYRRKEPSFAVTSGLNQLQKTTTLFTNPAAPKSSVMPGNLENNALLSTQGFKTYNLSMAYKAGLKGIKQKPANRLPKIVSTPSDQRLHDLTSSESSSVGRLYKGIFGPDMGNVVRKLAEKEVAPEGGPPTLITLQRESESPKLPRASSRVLVPKRRSSRLIDLSYNNLLDQYFVKEKNSGKLSAVKIRKAFEKLVDYIMTEGSHALREKFGKFVETGDSSNLFFCDLCPHCRMKHKDIYCVKQKMGEIPEEARDHYFLDCININHTIASLDQFHEYINAQSLKQMRPTDTELFHQFLEKLLQKEIDIKQLLDEGTLSELKKSYLYRGVPLDEDCRRFIATLDATLAAKFCYPSKDEDLRLAVALNKIYQKYFDLHVRRRGTGSDRISSARSYKGPRSTSNTPKNQSFDRPDSKPRKPKNSQFTRDMDFTSKIREKPIETELEEDTTFGRFFKHFSSKIYAKLPPKDPDSENYVAALYIAFQEIVREFSVKDKEKGYLMLKIFRKYQEAAEQNWFRVITQLVNYTLKLKHEVEYLLAQYFTTPEDVSRIMENSALSIENLAEHKRLINLCVGAYYSKESQLISLEKEKQALENDVKKWIYDWDIIRNSTLLSDRLRMIDENSVKSRAANHTEFRRAAKEEKVLLRNVEKFLMILPYRNQWEVERDQARQCIKETAENNEKLLESIDRMEGKLRALQVENLELEKSLAKANAEIEYAWNKLRIPRVKQQEIQSEISARDIEYIDELAKIHERKVAKKKSCVQKAIDKVSRGHYSAKDYIKKEEVYRIASWTFASLCKQKPTDACTFQYVHDLVYQVMIKMHGPEAKEYCGRLVATVTKETDWRIKYFGDTIGVGMKPVSEHMIGFYARLVSASGLEVDNVFSEAKNIHLSLNQAALSINKNRVVDNIADQRSDLWINKRLIAHSTIYLNEEPQKNLKEIDKLKYFYIHCIETGITNIHKKSLPELFIEYAKGKKKIALTELAQLFVDYSAVKFDANSAKEAINVMLSEGKEKEFALADIDRLFYWKIRFEIPLSAYLIVGAEIAKELSERAKDKLKELYEEYDKDHDNRLKYFEFMQMLTSKRRRTAKWEVFAIFDTIKRKDDSVEFDDLFNHLLFNPELKGFL